MSAELSPPAPKPADDRIRCDACPVMCYIRPGQAGACDRYANRDGELIRVDPHMIADVRADADNHLVLLHVTPGTPFVYYSGSAWDKGQGDFRTRKAWDAYAAGEKLDFGIPKERAR